MNDHSVEFHVAVCRHFFHLDDGLLSARTISFVFSTLTAGIQNGGEAFLIHATIVVATDCLNESFQGLELIGPKLNTK
jgi:hypothetical protein